MVDQSVFLIVLIVYLAPLLFIIWAITSVVGALKRIANALEAGIPQPSDTTSSGGPKAAAPKVDDDPARKYIPK